MAYIYGNLFINIAYLWSNCLILLVFGDDTSHNASIPWVRYLKEMNNWRIESNIYPYKFYSIYPPMSYILCNFYRIPSFLFVLYQFSDPNFDNRFTNVGVRWFWIVPALHIFLISVMLFYFIFQWLKLHNEMVEYRKKMIELKIILFEEPP